MKSVRSGSKSSLRPTEERRGHRAALTVSSKFVELQGFRSRSQVNAGSTFTFAALASRVESPDHHHNAAPFQGK